MNSKLTGIVGGGGGGLNKHTSAKCARRVGGSRSILLPGNFES